MRHIWTITILTCLALLIPTVVTAEDEKPTTQAPAATSTTTAPTTPKPKVKVLDSDLCKKCTCVEGTKLLDCSQKLKGAWLNDDDWKTLQNGDLIFDTINLQHNNLTNVPGIPAYGVKNLYLSFNQIVNITKAAFQNLTDLTKLDLSHNNITSKQLQPDIFMGQYSPQDILPLGKMIELDLGYNQLHSLDSDVFEHLPKLEMLVLCMNTFHIIDQSTVVAISSLRYLKTLDISYMELDEIPDTFLHGPRDLEVLILTGNLLKEIPDNIELGINLKQLVLDENPIEDFVGDNIFPKMKSLQYLSVSYLPDLTKIGKGAFGNLRSLTAFIAEGNPKLSYIDPYAFSKNTSNPLIFDYPPMEKLYLNNNNLSILPRELLSRWDNVKEIDLRFNPWICNCENGWLINTLMTQINETNPLQTNEVKCASPPDVKDISLMKLNEKKSVACKVNNGTGSSLVLIGMLIGILVGVPLTIASIVVYRRGCFGILERGGWVRARGDGALYNRANSFQDDFHI